MKKILIILLFAMSTEFAMAQVQVSRVGVGLSSWGRGAGDEFSSMFQPLNSTNRSSSLIPSLFATVDLFQGIGVEGRVAIANSTFTGESVFTGFTLTEEIKQRIVPLSFGAVYHKGLSDEFTVGAGVGINTYYIQNEVSRTVVGAQGSVNPTVFSGRTTGAYFKADAEYMFSEIFGVGLDMRYNTGNYNVNFRPEPGAPVQTTTNALAGFEIGLSLRVKVANLFKKSNSDHEGDEI